MTAVSADFSGFTSLYAEDLAVPGEGGKAEAGDVFAAGLFDGLNQFFFDGGGIVG